MDVIILLLCFFLLWEFYFFIHRLNKPNVKSLSRRAQQLIGIAGFGAAVVTAVLMKNEAGISHRGNQVVFPTFHLVFPGIFLGLIVIVGALLSIAVFIKAFRRSKDEFGLSEMAATSKLTDQNVLAEKARTNKNIFVRISAIGNITDPAILNDLAGTEKDETVLLAIREQLEKLEKQR